ncbi:MAG: glycosyltransferase [Bacteroidota bacterium]
MLSILIPVYNFDVRLLVAELYEQVNELDIEFEIRCYDDGSYFDFRMNNQRIAAYPNVTYRELPENIGRSKIRNLLAKDAKFDSLIFLDCDSLCEKGNFIKTYLDLNDGKTVICGGTRYAAETPQDQSLVLHWKTGREREITPLEERRSRPYRSFKSNNFFIPKQVFEKVSFNEDLVKYGHEDTLFGQHLKQHKIPILQIENPVLHLGLKGTHHFIESTHHAVENLAYLIKQGLADKTITLYKAYRTLSFLRLEKKMFKKLDRNRNFYLNQLYSSDPDLRKLDKLKLLWLMEEMRKEVG